MFLPSTLFTATKVSVLLWMKHYEDLLKPPERCWKFEDIRSIQKTHFHKLENWKKQKGLRRAVLLRIIQQNASLKNFFKAE